MPAAGGGAGGWRPLVGGNWKMHTTREEARALLGELRSELDGLAGIEIVIFPPAPWLADAHDLLAGSTLRVGAQHAHWERSGAFTGAVSAHQIAGIVDHVLVGHSERRQLFHECDRATSRLLAAALEAGLSPLLAVGETAPERDRGETEAVIRRQLLAAVDGLERLDGRVAVAYEPVWAIGAGESAAPSEAEQGCAAVRRIVSERFGAATAAGVRVLYGGSVGAGNARDLASLPSVDGALVGGASLRAAEFAGICREVAATGGG